MSLYFVPGPELVREIIHFILSSSPPRSLTPQEPGSSTNPSWLILDAFSLTSRTYRALTLEAWFRNLYLKSPDDVHFIRGHFPELLAKWTKSLHCVQGHGKIMLLWDLSGFRQLSAVRLDWLMLTIMPLYARHHEPDSLPFLNVSSNVEELELRRLTWPLPMAFQGIPHTFRNLKVLKIQQRCGLCSACCVVQFKDPGPTKIVYEGALGLPIDHAHTLSPLKHPETVIITAPAYGSGASSLENITLNPDPNTSPNPNLWFGECDKCMRTSYEDDVSRERWLSRKRGTCGDDEGQPPKLGRVEWRFRKADADEEVPSLDTLTFFETTDSEGDDDYGDDDDDGGWLDKVLVGVFTWWVKHV